MKPTGFSPEAAIRHLTIGLRCYGSKWSWRRSRFGLEPPKGRGNTVKIGALTEIFAGENRVSMTPDSALQLVKLGHSCCIQAGAGAKAGFSDALYAKAGVEVLADAAAGIAAADVPGEGRGPGRAPAPAFPESPTP